MAKSILQSEKKCFKTSDRCDLHKHHIFYGCGLRKLSERYGCWIYLRADYHNMSDYGVHFNHAFDLQLKKLAQRKFEAIHGHERFMQVFGRNYLDDAPAPVADCGAFVETESEEVLPY